MSEAAARRSLLAPLALAQFICSFPGSNMNVMNDDITEDLDIGLGVMLSGPRHSAAAALASSEGHRLA
jgi:hypothetical protein